MDANDFDSLIATKIGELFGFIANNGRVIIQPKFEDVASPGFGDFAAVKHGGKWRLIDTQGNFTSDNSFERLRSFSWHQFEALANGKIGIINHLSEWSIPPCYDQIEEIDWLEDVHFLVKGGGKYGIINEQNKLLLDLKYSEIKPGVQPYVVTRSANGYGVYSLSDGQIIPEKYADIDVCSVGTELSLASFQFETANPERFSDYYGKRYIKALLNDKWCLIDYNDNLIAVLYSLEEIEIDRLAVAWNNRDLEN